MAFEAGVISSVAWQATGGGTLVTVPKSLIEFPTLGGTPETVLLATGINTRLRDRDEVALRCYDISHFAALKTLMLARTNLEFTITGGSVHVWDPVRFSVRYLLGQVPNAAEIFVGADGATGTPASTPANWTSLGPIEAGQGPQITINGPNDGTALQLYTTTSLEWSLRLADNAAATALASYQRSLCRIAIRSPDGTYLILGGASAGQGVLSQWQAAPRFGIDQFASGIDLSISGVAQDPDQVLVIPGSAPDYVYGFELNLAAVSTLQSDYYTRT